MKDGIFAMFDANFVCYGWDAFNKKVFRFISPYQRMLWIKNGHPEFPEDRQELDGDHYLVRKIKTWSFNGQGFEEGQP